MRPCALTGELSRTPTVAELAERLRVSEEAVLEAQESAAGYSPASLNAPGRRRRRRSSSATCSAAPTPTWSRSTTG